MRIELNKTEHAAVTRMMAEAWAVAKCRAAAPVNGCWNHPFPRSERERRAWQIEHQGKAALYSAVLFKLGVTTPDIDASRFIRPYNAPRAKPGEVCYESGKPRADYLRELVAGMLA
jgi:hypothetical protein